MDSEIDRREKHPAFLCGVATVLSLSQRPEIGASAQGSERVRLKHYGHYLLLRTPTSGAPTGTYSWISIFRGFFWLFSIPSRSSGRFWSGVGSLLLLFGLWVPTLSGPTGGNSAGIGAIILSRRIGVSGVFPWSSITT